jgi:hypothetical protein
VTKTKWLQNKFQKKVLLGINIWKRRFGKEDLKKIPLSFEEPFLSQKPLQKPLQKL